jgi:hypothetical protein
LSEARANRVGNHGDEAAVRAESPRRGKRT